MELIPNKREWNNCFIKYQTLGKYISDFIEVMSKLLIQPALSFEESFHI